jgi:hypothetical protein
MSRCTTRSRAVHRYSGRMRCRSQLSAGDLRNNPGSLTMLVAIRRASSRVSVDWQRAYSSLWPNTLPVAGLIRWMAGKTVNRRIGVFVLHFLGNEALDSFAGIWAAVEERRHARRHRRATGNSQLRKITYGGRPISSGRATSASEDRCLCRLTA